MQWLEITVNSTPDEIDRLAGDLEELGVSGLVIDDESAYHDFLENNRQYWDYVDSALEEAIRGVCRVKFYLEDSEAGRAELARLQSALPGCDFLTNTVRDEDWENNWKAYYKPLPVGERLLIVPQWESAPPADGRKILRLDPGLIFGTGTHPTTQMCLRALEKLELRGKQVLDLGCGSGILAIAALILGAEHAAGCDIDPKAPDVAMENAALNGITPENISVFAGDVLSDRDLNRRLGAGKYGVVLANIVADVIIALAPKVRSFLSEGGVFLCSGIIEGREDEVKAALTKAGLTVLDAFEQDGWHCFACQ